MSESYKYLQQHLQDDLKKDPFKRLGKWSEFITNKVYFAIFIHPDPSSAYQVYQVINTRGVELTTADLLNNYVLLKQLRRNGTRVTNNGSRYHGSFLPPGRTLLSSIFAT